MHLSVQRPRPYYSAFNPPKETFDILLKTSSRWKVMHTQAFDNFREVVKLSANLFPLLSELSISTKLYPFACVDFEWDVSDASCLKKLRVEDWTPGIIVDWSRLSDLTITANLTEFTGILPQCTNLETCNYEPDVMCVAMPGPNASNTFIMLPVLTSFEFKGNPTATTCIFGRMKAPNLKSLQLQFLFGSFNDDGYMEEHWTPQFIAFLRRSCCPLTEFRMFGALGRIQTYILMLHELPHTLTRLALCPGGAITDVFIKLLNPTLAPEILPNLKELVLDDTYLRLSIDVLLAMIKGRVSPPPASNLTQIPVPKIDRIEIVCYNAKWIRKLNPNDLLAFYKEVTVLSSSGSSITLSYSPDGDSGDADSED